MHYLYFVHYLKCKQYLCFETFTVQANYNSLATNITHYANSDNVKLFFLKPLFRTINLEVLKYYTKYICKPSPPCFLTCLEMEESCRRKQLSWVGFCCRCSCHKEQHQIKKKLILGISEKLKYQNLLRKRNLILHRRLVHGTKY